MIIAGEPLHGALWRTRERLLRRKRVTIAIGLLADDGVVVAADTQETLGSYKSTESKLLIANQGTEKAPAGAIVTTGAGDAGYMDCINQEICAAFLRKNTWDARALFIELKKQVKEFHHDHVVPFSALPYDERPSVGIIIAAQVGDKKCLYTTERSTVFGGKKYCAVGLGRPYAQMMLRRFWDRMDTTRAASLAAYVLFHVKNTVDGCGNETQIVIIKDGHAKFVSQPNINLLEHDFEEQAALENQLVHFGLGCALPEGDEKTALARLGSLVSKKRGDVMLAQKFNMTSFRRGINPLEQPEMKPSQPKQSAGRKLKDRR